jgi:hypothetical protein
MGTAVAGVDTGSVSRGGGHFVLDENAEAIIETFSEYDQRGVASERSGIRAESDARSASVEA